MALLTNEYNTIEELKAEFPKWSLSWYWTYPKSACVCLNKETGKYFFVTGQECVIYRQRNGDFVEYLNIVSEVVNGKSVGVPK